jgi:hypothetical protein
MSTNGVTSPVAKIPEVDVVTFSTSPTGTPAGYALAGDPSVCPSVTSVAPFAIDPELLPYGVNARER